MEQELFDRTELLLGKDFMDRLGDVRVILFGVGGVGSWCAESLIRSGIGHLTIVDSDKVCASNVNRQLMATTKTIGHVKVDALKSRLLEINPNAEVVALQKIYDSDTADSFNLDSFDYIVDAIDSLKNKIDLIRRATRTKAVLFSSMGAALKVDPMRVEVADFWKVRGCPLAAAIRKRIKKGDMPAKKFKCVFSEELLPNKGEGELPKKPNCLPEANNDDLQNHDWNTKKAQINGTLAHITAIFGFTLAGLVMQDLYDKIDS